jgi:anti-sigma regulatory factor (Ser/Thr protein kinase)
VTDTLSLSFPREPDSVPAARAALDHFEGHVASSRLYDASLCLSELVTNAIQHPDRESGDELELELRLTEEALRVQVVDPGAGFSPGPPTEGDERGWGLFIVDQLSSRWGTEPGERTVMWFEVERAERAAPGDAAEGGRSDAPGPGTGRARQDEIANMVARLRARPAIQ